VSSPIATATLDPAFVEAMTARALPRLVRPHGDAYEAVILDLEGVLTRPTRARAPGERSYLESDGEVDPCPDAAAALQRWRRGDLRCAVVTSRRNGHRVLRAAGLGDAVDVVVDGRAASELGLRSKAAMLRTAARRLGVDPRDAVVLVASAAGVCAGAEAAFGLVVGVDRDGCGSALSQAGAHVVTRNVLTLRFPRRLPSVLECHHALTAWRGGRSIAVFLDYDGTLAPAVDDEPTAAGLAPAMRATLEALAERWPVAIVSGRDRADLEARVDVADLLYAGSHGLDIAGRGLLRRCGEAELALPELERAHARLVRLVGAVPGVQIERRRFSLAVGHREVADPHAVQAIERAVDAVLATTRLRRRMGPGGIELRPDVDWDEGRAVRWMMDVLGLEPRRTFAIHVGHADDEDAFAALAGMGAGICVGDANTTSLADWSVRDSEEVGELLRWLESAD
jgi:trehalose 6-phosphate phosphatase